MRNDSWNTLKNRFKSNSFFLFCRFFRLNFSARQNIPPSNNGWDSYSLDRNYPNSYFYGTVKEFEDFHKKKRGKHEETF